MKVEKQGTMGGGGRYVGTFLHLFDWNGKSHKKLFSKTLDFSEQPRQKKESNANTPITQYHKTVEDDTAGGLSFKQSNNYSYASSLTDEDDYGIKAPGVVARLMGLNSLPTSNFSDTHSNPSFDSQSVHDSSSFYAAKSLELEQKDYHQTEQKPRAIEKFRTETLPPKSARSVPITQNKLLSPIKSSGFVSSNNPDRIMEAASKIPIVQSSSSSSSVSFSARKPSKNLKGQLMNKNRNDSLQSKPEKSVSLAFQAKVNVQKREGSRNLFGAEPIKKRSTNNVLKQNNQKQNCIIDRGKSASKSSVSSNSQSKQPLSQKIFGKTPMKSAEKNVNRRKRFMEDEKNEACDKSNRMDVVSFTFTSPISRSIPSPVIDMEKKNAFLPDNRGKNILATEGGSLGTLLDQKLRELKLITDSPVSGFQDSSHRINKMPIFQDKRTRDRINKNEWFSGFSSDDPWVPEETSFRMESFIYSNTEGFSNKSTMMEVDTELRDSVRCTESELGYIKDVLSNIESMFEDFTLDRTQKIVNPLRFDQLESQRPVFKKKNEPKLRRKLVFDCVSECIGSRHRVWARGVETFRRKDWLFEEVCNEIFGWEDMKDCVVDELLDKDMSGDKFKRWLDYDVEAFEFGVEIERRILNSLIDEALADMLVL